MDSPPLCPLQRMKFKELIREYEAEDLWFYLSEVEIQCTYKKCKKVFYKAKAMRLEESEAAERGITIDPAARKVKEAKAVKLFTAEFLHAGFMKGNPPKYPAAIGDLIKMALQRQSGAVPPPPYWVQDLQNGLPPKPRNVANIPDPPGFSSRRDVSAKQKSQIASRKQPTDLEMNTLKLKKAWEIALAPAKQVPMQAIMMYMSGNTLQIFSIMMVYMLFKNPIQGITQTNTVFARFDGAGTRGQIFGIKAAYVVMQFLLLGLGVYKVNAMGLLPTTRSDWLAWETERQPLERAYFAFGQNQ